MGIFGHINWRSPDFWTINSNCTTQNKYFLSTLLVACNMQPADSLFSFVAKNGWKNMSPSAIGLWRPPLPAIKSVEVIQFSYSVHWTPLLWAPTKTEWWRGGERGWAKNSGAPNLLEPEPNLSWTWLLWVKPFVCLRWFFTDSIPWDSSPWKPTVLGNVFGSLFPTTKKAYPRSKIKTFHVFNVFVIFSNHRTNKSNFPDIVWPYMLPLEKPTFFGSFWGLVPPNPTTTLRPHIPPSQALELQLKSTMPHGCGFPCRRVVVVWWKIFHVGRSRGWILGLGGGFEYFLFSPLLGEDSHFD